MEENNIFENDIDEVSLNSEEETMLNGKYADEDYYRSRFSSAEWFNTVQNINVLVIGAGGIGSHAALNISKLGCGLCVNDFDYVENVNMSGQLHPISEIGSLKTRSVKRLINMFCGNSYTDYMFDCIEDNLLNLDIDSFVNEIKSYDVVVFALDSIETRKALFNNISRFMPKDIRPQLLIDGRLTAELLQVYTCNLLIDDSIERYRGTLFDSSESMATVCSFKQTFYMASMISSIITNQIVNFAVNRISEMPSPQPFFIEYNSRMLDFKYEF